MSANPRNLWKFTTIRHKLETTYSLTFSEWLAILHRKLDWRVWSVTGFVSATFDDPPTDRKLLYPPRCPPSPRQCRVLCLRHSWGDVIHLLQCFILHPDTSLRRGGGFPPLSSVPGGRKTQRGEVIHGGPVSESATTSEAVRDTECNVVWHGVSLTYWRAHRLV